MSSNNSFDKLTKVVVGREANFEKRVADFSFKYFYQESLKQNIYDKSLDYYVDYELCLKRNEQLDNLANILYKNNIEVYRPESLTKISTFSTPEFKSEISSANNIRDISLVYKDFIIETPVFVRNRYFENKALYNIYNNMFINHNYNWVRSPHNILIEEQMDLEPWDTIRDYKSFDKLKYTMAIDGAQFLRINNDVIVNINSYNHYMGLEWIKKIFPETTFHIINIADNHIDGAIMCPCEGTLVINHKYKNIIQNILPEKFKNWRLIIPHENKTRQSKNNALASIDGMDINFISINPKTIISNKNAIYVNDILDKNGFNIIECELDDCELFGGGIHCSTLDLERISNE